MSSILDALRKLEAEKADAVAPDDLILDNVAVERELVGDGLMRSGTTVRITPGVLIAGVVGLSVLIGMLATAGVAFWWMRPAPPAVSVAKGQPPVPESPPVSVTQVASVAPSFPVPVTPSAPQPQPVSPSGVVIEPPSPPTTAQSTPLPTSVPTPVPAPPVSTTPVPESEASIPLNRVPDKTEKNPVADAVPHSGKGTRFVPGQEDKPVVVASAEPVSKQPVQPVDPPIQPAKVTVTPEVEKASPKKEEDVDVFALPVLTESDKARFGLTKLRVNMVRPAGKNAPYASAVINLRPVYVGERIPETTATLVGVADRGIAIEAGDAGERFHVRF